MNGGSVVGLTLEGNFLGGNGRECLNVYMKFWKGLHVPPLSIDFCFGVPDSITISIRASQAVSANSVRNESPGTQALDLNLRLTTVVFAVSRFLFEYHVLVIHHRPFLFPLRIQYLT